MCVVLFMELFKKFSRKINKKLTGPNLYLKYFNDNIVWENTVFFESYTGQSFQGNPYFIFKEMLKRSDCSAMKFYIAVIDVDEWKNKLKKRGLLHKNVHIVTYGSVAYVNALCHCKYLINNVVFNAKFIKKDNQIYLNTWHGTGPKSCGNKLAASPKAFINPQRNFLMADYLLCPNKSLIIDDHMISGLCEEKFLPFGYPRNSIFYDKQHQKNMIIKNNLSGKTVVFYLPTWRDRDRLEIDLQAVKEIDLIAGKLKDTHVFYCKLHPNMLKINPSIKNCKTVPDDCELYELLSCADYLITDWSSVYTDFANKTEKIILYQYDRDYMLDGRGFYDHYIKNTPFPIAKTGDDVINLLINSFEVDNYQDFIDIYCTYDSLDCTKDIVDSFLSADKTNYEKQISLVYIDKRISSKEINDLKGNLSNIHNCTNYKFVIPDNLCDEDYLYFNRLDDFCYLMVSFDQLNKNSKSELRRLWGNIKIDKLFCENINMIPKFLVDNAKEVVIFK